MSTATPRRIALVSAPWHDPFLPSIQLATLKGYVERALPDVAVDTFHFYFQAEEAIGLELGQRIAQSGGLLGEAVFAYHLFPAKRDDIIAFLRDEQRRQRTVLDGLDLVADVVEPMGRALARAASAVDWRRYLLVGFSIVFNQVLASLLAARHVRAAAPEVVIAAGGPSCAGEVGHSLLHAFPELDLVVNGEGEVPLTELLTRLVDGRSDLEDVPGVVTSRSTGRQVTRISQMANLGSLPPPDFASYFADADAAVTRPLVYRRAAIPVESSRGCWWDRSHVDPALACSFCSLNLQWSGYREKSVEQFVSELDELVRQFGVRDFLLVDNILRYKDVEELCARVTALPGRVALGIEARVSVKPSQLRLLAEAGVVYVQFGIEALSSRVLQVINKGTTTIQNVQAMKFCERFGMANFSNIITRHPGVEPDAVRETLANLEFVTCYPPLKVSQFSLGYQSPIYKNPGAFGVSGIRNLDALRRCLPGDLADRVFWPDKSFDSDMSAEVLDLWRRVEREVDAWADRFDASTREHGVSSLLLSEDLGRRLRITDYRASPPRTFEMDAPTRELYLACEETRSLESLRRALPGMGVDELAARLQALTRDRLMLREGRRYLALAIPADPARRMAYPVERSEAAPPPALPVAGR